jgi:predicted amino acid dehydrogenase
MGKFAFLIHPRDVSDVSRPIPWAKLFPNWLVENAIRFLPKKFDILPWANFDVFGKAEGWIIVVFLTGEQMLTLPRRYVQDRILEAVLFAQDRLGANLVGLGAYTAPLTDSGKWLVKQDSVRINITHGDSYSVAIAIEGIHKIVRELKLESRMLDLAIVGAYGLIGKAMARLLSSEFKSMLLIGRNELKLEKLKEELKNFGNITASTNISDIVRSDIIITATSYPGALIQPQHIKEKAIIYDIAQPINVSKGVCEKRPDIIRIDGCFVKIPGIDLKADMGPPKGTTFSCLAETIMQALEDDDEDHVGEIDLSHVKRTSEWQKKYGFKHADFTNFGHTISTNKPTKYQ